MRVQKGSEVVWDLPMVDDEGAIHVDARAVVHGHVEGVRLGPAVAAWR